MSKKRNHDKTRTPSAYNLFVKENNAAFQAEILAQPPPPPPLGPDGLPGKAPSMFVRVSKLAAEKWKVIDQEPWKQKARELSAAAEKEEEPKKKKKHRKRFKEDQVPEQQQEESKGPECCVCLQPFHAPERRVSVFGCGHWCCDQCFFKLPDGKCPVCREAIGAAFHSSALASEFEELAKKIKARPVAAQPAVAADGPKVGDAVDAKV